MSKYDEIFTNKGSVHNCQNYFKVYNCLVWVYELLMMFCDKADIEYKNKNVSMEYILSLFNDHK